MENKFTDNTPDVLGMTMPAAVELLDAAGISHTEEVLQPLKLSHRGKGSADGPMRVIRQLDAGDGKVRLSLCRVEDPFIAG